MAGENDLFMDFQYAKGWFKVSVNNNGFNISWKLHQIFIYTLIK